VNNYEIQTLLYSKYKNSTVSELPDSEFFFNFDEPNELIGNFFNDAFIQVLDNGKISLIIELYPDWSFMWSSNIDDIKSFIHQRIKMQALAHTVELCRQSPVEWTSNATLLFELEYEASTLSELIHKVELFIKQWNDQVLKREQEYKEELASN